MQAWTKHLGFISEIWREYVGYDLDLEVLPVIPHPDLVSNGNDYTELVDGNLATCVVVEPMACHAGQKVIKTRCGSRWNRRDSIGDSHSISAQIFLEFTEFLKYNSIDYYFD